MPEVLDKPDAYGDMDAGTTAPQVRKSAGGRAVWMSGRFPLALPNRHGRLPARVRQQLREGGGGR